MERERKIKNKIEVQQHALHFKSRRWDATDTTNEETLQYFNQHFDSHCVFDIKLEFTHKTKRTS